MVAGNLKSLGQLAFDESGVSFVAEKDGRKEDVWVYAPAEQEVAVEFPESDSGGKKLVFDDGSSVATDAVAGTRVFRLPSRAGQKRVQTPPELAGKAPRDWPGDKPAIGILDFGPGLDPTWTRIKPDDWFRSLSGSRLVSEHGLAIRRIANYPELQAALAGGPTKYLAIINPYGEIFPPPRPADGAKHSIAYATTFATAARGGKPADTRSTWPFRASAIGGRRNRSARRGGLPWLGGRRRRYRTSARGPFSHG